MLPKHGLIVTISIFVLVTTVGAVVYYLWGWGGILSQDVEQLDGKISTLSISQPRFDLAG